MSSLHHQNLVNYWYSCIIVLRSQYLSGLQYTEEIKRLRYLHVLSVDPAAAVFSWDALSPAEQEAGVAVAPLLAAPATFGGVLVRTCGRAAAGAVIVVAVNLTHKG